MTALAVQQWFTAVELADLASACRLDGLPWNERAVRRQVEREGWNDLPPHLARPRSGTGGRPPMEYHRSLLPESVLIVLREHQALALQAEAHALAVQDDGRRLAALKASALAPRARAVMLARAEILSSIDGYAIAQGQSRAWGIARFLDAQADLAARERAETRRDAGTSLTEREIASLAQAALLTAAEGFHLSSERIRTANDRAGRAGIGRSTIYEWFRLRDGSGPVALAPVPPKEAQPIPAEFTEFLKFYARPQKPTASDAHGQYVRAAAGSGRELLSLHQVKRILRERMNNVERHVGREGLLTLRSRMAFVTRTTENMWPTTIYSADGKTFAAEVADPVTKSPIRPEITTIIDVVTRRIVGTSYARSENQRSVAEALRNACLTGGVPAIFYTDRGPGYRNEALDADVAGLMGRLGITKSHAAPYGSQAKGRIERPNATIWDVLARRFPTYIGADMDKEAGQAIHKITRREIKAFGQSRHLPAWEEFVSSAEAMVVEYNNRPHRSLPKFEDPETGKMRHLTPNEAWQAHVEAGFEAVTVDPAEADDLFRPYEFRTVRRGLVQWNNNQYFHVALEAWHEMRVMVGYDYAQADRVWVRAFDVGTGQPGQLICVAEFNGNAERYFPVSFEQKALETRAAARLRRLGDKVARVEAELDAVQLLDAQTLDQAPFLIAEPGPEPLAVPVATIGASGRRIFRSDEELAAWALERPDELTPNQISLLRDCLARPAARELFRLSGIDVEALRTLLRAAA